MSRQGTADVDYAPVREHVTKYLTVTTAPYKMCNSVIYSDLSSLRRYLWCAGRAEQLRTVCLTKYALFTLHRVGAVTGTSRSRAAAYVVKQYKMQVF